MIGWIVRSTPGALVSYFALILVLPVFGQLFGSAGKHVAQFLPSQAGEAFVTSSARVAAPVAEGRRWLVLLAWVAAGIARRR